MTDNIYNDYLTWFETLNRIIGTIDIYITQVIFQINALEKGMKQMFPMLYPTLTRCFVVLPLSKVTGTKE